MTSNRLNEDAGPLMEIIQSDEPTIPDASCVEISKCVMHQLTQENYNTTVNCTSQVIFINLITTVNNGTSYTDQNHKIND